MTDHLANLARATKERARLDVRRETMDGAWRDAITAALCTHTQAEVAKSAGITQARVNQIAHGKR